MPINSREKGKSIERQACAFLRELGFPSARRGQQHRGGQDSPDVVCDELPGVHLEVKGDNRIKLGTRALDDAIEQARGDANGSAWAVLWRNNRTGWRLTFETRIMGESAVVTVAADSSIYLALLELRRRATFAAFPQDYPPPAREMEGRTR